MLLGPGIPTISSYGSIAGSVWRRLGNDKGRKAMSKRQLSSWNSRDATQHNGLDSSCNPVRLASKRETTVNYCPVLVDTKVWIRLQYYARLRKVISYVEQHLPDPVRLPDLANACCINPTSLSRLFKARVGITLQQFLSAYKVSKAHEMMITSDISITEIAYMLGFANLSTFERTFRRVTGQTPSEYRNGLLERTGVFPSGMGRRNWGIVQDGKIQS